VLVQIEPHVQEFRLTSLLQSPLQRLQFLDRIARALHHAEGLEAAIEVAREGLVPQFADVVILVMEQFASEERIEVISARPDQVPDLTDSLRSQLPALRRLARAEAAEERRFRWVPQVTPVSTRFLQREPAVHSLLEELGVKSLLAVPLRSNGNTLGAMAMLRTSPGKPFQALDLSAAQIVARRIAEVVHGSALRERLVKEEWRSRGLESTLQKWIRVFDHAAWGAAIVDEEEQRIEAVNPAFAALHGYVDPVSLSGKPYADLLPPERKPEPASWRGETTPPVYESFHFRADGSVFPVLTNVTSLGAAYGGRSYVVTVQDLTELKRAEERLRRAQRLEAVGRLAGGVAHEVNNMMTIIMGFSDLLARSGAVSSDRQRDLEEIRKAATRAGKITQQLLAFSRQQILQPADLKLNEAVIDLIPVLKLLLPANIELETALIPASPLVRVDRAQLEQVIINLAFNARDAMPDGGTVRLVTETRRLENEDGRALIGIPITPGNYALISVVDTGHGMDLATLQQVFEPFFTTKPMGSGTGLGLATVYGIVKQSGGYVWVSSTPGIGTTVTVCLPQVSAEAPVQETASPDSIREECRGGTLLVIEDETGVRELAQRVLEQQGHMVLVARDGNEAQQQLREFGAELDLVLSDVIVPNIGTTELEQLVRQTRPDLPILYMSGYSHEDVVSRGLIEATQPFLQKPFTALELVDLVCRQMLSSEGRSRQITT
jgi:two-component system, cell cycle sensor histidine kinase and response regulator CckA